MRSSIPISPLQYQRILTMDATLQTAKRELELFCDAILAGAGVQVGHIVDVTETELVYESPADVQPD